MIVWYWNNFLVSPIWKVLFSPINLCDITKSDLILPNGVEGTIIKISP